ncbi:MAG TPA: helix-turn-helix transcriptional regulator [Elusimicrobiota bacterium]|jgi:transcriptional regulator with XRE-family HTH domain|nr:helix-turn-helix transcriptional regulator [Elusimicrobiota bacterium]
MSDTPFAAWVRERMRERGLGLRELCRAAKVDPSFLSKVLAGKRSPPWEEDVLRRMAGVLEVEAPRLIVLAGRVPSEWERLMRDAELFRSLDGFVRGGVRAPAPAREAAPVRRQPAAPMGEELL